MPNYKILIIMYCIYDLKGLYESFDVLVMLVAKPREGVAKTQGVCVSLYTL